VEGFAIGVPHPAALLENENATTRDKVMPTIPKNHDSHATLIAEIAELKRERDEARAECEQLQGRLNEQTFNAIACRDSRRQRGEEMSTECRSIWRPENLCRHKEPKDTCRDCTTIAQLRATVAELRGKLAYVINCQATDLGPDHDRG
jgi:hypothetical protein